MKDFSKNEWGLVLNGGGGKGAYQIGVFKALYEHKICDYITGVSGTSSGALNSALFAHGDLDTSVKAWESVSPETFLQISPELIDFKEGLLTRDGLIKIFDDYIDFERIRMSDKTIYATVTDFGPNDETKGTVRYLRLNYRPVDEIRDILLASSALPIIYSPVRIDGNVCRDGGMEDNMPISPLYIEGIRHFIVVGLSEETEIPYEKFPDAEFLLIRPEESLGDFITGTLDFTKSGAKTRMELGYIDAIRRLEFAEEDMSSEIVRFRYQEAVRRDYNKIFVESKKADLEEMINSNMNKINDIFNEYMGD